MKWFVGTAYLVVGVINIAPLVGVLGPERLQSLYGVAIAGADLELLMRHRAVLLGLVGALLMVAAFRPGLRPVAVVAGFVSMLSFLALALPLAQVGAPMQWVFWADVVACVLLLSGTIAMRLARKSG